MSGRSWDHGGKTRQQRGYGRQWESIRAVVLQRDKHLCQPCKRRERVTVAVAVDHITPKAKGGTDDLANLEAICSPCHTDKGLRDQGKRPARRVRIGTDGWPVED